MGRDEEAEQHIRRAIELAPEQSESHYFYARWLEQKGSWKQAELELKSAITANPAYMDARYLLLKLYAETDRTADLQALLAETRRIAPLAAQQQALSSQRPLPTQVKPETQLADSLRYYQAGNFPACIKAAQNALRLRPTYAEAYNNIAVAEQSLGNLDAAIRAGQEAVRLKPDFQLAKNNLASARQKKNQQQGIR